MRARGFIWLGLALATTATALAADDPIAERRKVMRDNYKVERAANSLILGKFNAEKAAAAMQRLEDNMALFITLFPEGSETGGESKASPLIWTERANFEAVAADLVAKAVEAKAAAAIGQDAFAVAWQAVAESCPACHTQYAPAADFQ